MTFMRSSVCAALLAGCGLAGSASADVVNIAGGPGIEFLGSFTGTIDYAADTGTLVISLTNELTTAAGGKITGFVFNIDGDATATLISGTHPFTNLTGGGLDASPFGTFEAGAALGGNWAGGGSPNPGIARGNKGSFTFSVKGDDAASLTAADFCFGGPDDVNFAVRFRGFSNGGSDKVGGHIVPGPASAALAGLGLAAMGRRRRVK